MNRTALIFGLLCVIDTPNVKASSEITATLTADAIRNVSGGFEHGTDFLYNLDVSKSWSTDQVTVHATLNFTNAGNLSSTLVGDLQGADNIEAPDDARLFEFWIAKEFSKLHSVRFGVMDLNAEFDSLENSKLFLQSSHGMGPDLALSGKNGPSIFPATTVGIRYQRNTPRSTWRTAIFDAEPGNPDDPRSGAIDPGGGVLGITEFDTRHTAWRSIVGYWRYSSALTAWGIGADSHSQGIYFAAESTGTKPRWFVRVGRSTSSTNVVDQYLGAGIVTKGFRSNHQFGVAVASAHISAKYRKTNSSMPSASAETSLEITYEVSVSETLSVQFEWQRILDPASVSGSFASPEHATVAGLRLTLSL